MGRPIRYKNLDARVIAIRDITERKRAEEELKYAHDQLRALAIRLQEVREETRTTISHDLHDDVGGNLTGLKMDLLRVEGIFLKANDVEQRNVLMEVSHQAKEFINKTILSARRIMMELRPSVLDDFGLVTALEWQVEEFKTHTGISCQFVVEQQKVDLEKHTATTIFRIFQEVLANVARHSGATEVIVRPEIRTRPALSTPFKVSLDMLRFHQILRPNESFHTFLLFPRVNLIFCY